MLRVADCRGKVTGAVTRLMQSLLFGVSPVRSRNLRRGRDGPAIDTAAGRLSAGARRDPHRSDPTPYAKVDERGEVCS